MKRALLGMPLVILAAAGANCTTSVPCLQLSPECARTTAELRVDVVNLPGDATWVRVSVAEVTRETGSIRDHQVSLYFYDVPDQSAVSVHVDARFGRDCDLPDVMTGPGETLTIDVGGHECHDVDDRPGRDGGHDEDGSSADAGDEDHDGGHRDKDSGPDVHDSGHGPEPDAGTPCSVDDGGCVVDDGGDGQHVDDGGH